MDRISEESCVILSLGGHAEGQSREPTVTPTVPRSLRDRADTVLGVAYF